MSQPVELQLRYFASVREAVGTGAESWTSQAATVAGLRDELIARGGAWAQSLARCRAVRVAVDQVLQQDESAALRPGAEIAFFPPVTGG
ncbi:molybdopterin synthase sulfur carrier subunit [Xylophilus rhododendri]|uniref:Molybdopterin synthase sulfur carrier subunit n=1 Tax=Xylophilus rhododendri TaxID=2697032 RepID=A0A857JDB0_9BURK|nr:MoaD/ThiS family protein [Xylophilus rhododendri]QHJ00749.1 molybdopterin synthase sulfur carrier subunit [Xylophilus rhododendri]